MGACGSSRIESSIPAGWMELFIALKLTRSDIRKMYKMYKTVDLDDSGSVDTVELLTLLDIERTRFTEHIFTIFDSDGSGKVDFREFVLALWNYCTIGPGSLEIFTFDLFDVDASGELSAEEVSQMLKDIYGKKHANDPKIKIAQVELRKIDGKTGMNLTSFKKFTQHHHGVMFPAFQLQHQLQRSVLGVGFWHRASERRVQLSKGKYVTLSELMRMHLNQGLYDRAVSESNILRMSSNARLIIKTTGTNQRRQSTDLPHSRNIGPPPTIDNTAEPPPLAHGDHHADASPSCPPPRRGTTSSAHPPLHGGLNSLQLPVYVLRPGAAASTATENDIILIGVVNWNEVNRPDPILRRFCQTHFYQQDEKCRNLINYFTEKVTEIYGPDKMYLDFNNDMILERISTGYNEWISLNINLDLQPLTGKDQSASLLLPSYTTNIYDTVNIFCEQHSIPGISCRELMFELVNYVTSLYFRPGGATLQNILRGMHLQSDLDTMHFPITLETDPADTKASKFFFATDLQYAVPSVCRFCMRHNLNREKCTVLVDYTDRQLQAYFGSSYAGQLWALQYVLNALHSIAQNRPSKAPISEYIVADYVEIGTSNFDTVTQHVQDADGFTGFAVEPMKHYLDSLPIRKGVRKVHAAIVTQEPDSSTVDHHRQPQQQLEQDSTVDLYYIPEEVIDRLGLYYYLKGCNSIGAYHPGHIELNVTQHVVVEKVPALTITAFLRIHRIKRIRLLKIDAEGYDLTIMEELYQHIVRRERPLLHIDRVIFESADEIYREGTMDIIQKFTRLGYTLLITGENTILEQIVPI